MSASDPTRAKGLATRARVVLATSEDAGGVVTRLRDRIERWLASHP